MQDGIESEDCTDTSSSEDEEVQVRPTPQQSPDSMQPTPSTPNATKTEPPAAGKKLRTAQPSPPVHPQVTLQGEPIILIKPYERLITAKQEAEDRTGQTIEFKHTPLKKRLHIHTHRDTIKPCSGCRRDNCQYCQCPQCSTNNSMLCDRCQLTSLYYSIRLYLAGMKLEPLDEQAVTSTLDNIYGSSVQGLFQQVHEQRLRIRHDYITTMSQTDIDNALYNLDPTTFQDLPQAKHELSEAIKAASKWKNFRS